MVLIAQLSDPHVVEPGDLLLGGIDTKRFLQAAVAHVVALDPAPDVVLISGDLVNDGRAEQYAHLAELLAPLGSAVRLLPGNHDHVPTLRAAFPGQVHAREGRADGVLEGEVRVVCLDSSRFPEPGGHLDPAQLAWLDATLRESPVAAVVVVHHPPFASGIRHMDGMALSAEASQGLAAVVAEHGHVERVLCGHLHRTITRRFASTIAMTAPSTAHAVHLELGDGAPAWTDEPPGVLLHRWDPVDGLVTHLSLIGDHPPVPFGM